MVLKNIRLQLYDVADISTPTFVSIEKGNPNVSIGAYIKVLFALWPGKDILNIANDDILGRKLQDAGITIRMRAPKKKTKIPADSKRE